MKPHWSDLEGFEIYGFRDCPVGEADAPVASTMLPLKYTGMLLHAYAPSLGSVDSGNVCDWSAYTIWEGG